MIDIRNMTSAEVLSAHHYLGPIGGVEYRDELGIIIFGNPVSRRLPKEWRELKRWCLPGQVKNAGSMQWSRACRWIADRTAATTIVSYSDPAVGHTGALYRAANWLWAPTWHRLREPPTGGGIRSGKRHSAKDRWVFLLRPDPNREELLAVEDESIMRRMPWASYREPTWRCGRAQQDGGGDYKRWARQSLAEAA